MTLFYCITDQVQVLSICVNFCRSNAPFGTKNTGNTQFFTLFSYMLWHIELEFCIWLYFTVLQIKLDWCQFPSIFVGVMPLLDLRILEILRWNLVYNFLFIRPSSDGTYYGMVMSVRPTGSPSGSPTVSHSFPHFAPTCFDVLSWNLAFYFLLINISSSFSVANFRQVL